MMRVGVLYAYICLLIVSTIARVGLGVKSSQSVAEMSTSSSPARYFDAVDWGEMVEKLQEKEERLEKMVKEYKYLWKEKEEQREKRMRCMERDLREVKMKEKEFEEKCREKDERSEERMRRMERDLR